MILCTNDNSHGLMEVVQTDKNTTNLKVRGLVCQMTTITIFVALRCQVCNCSINIRLTGEI